MYSILPKPAFDDFLALSKSARAELLQRPVSAVCGDKVEIERQREAIRETLAVADGGWPVESLFSLRKIIEIAMPLHRASVSEYYILWELFEALREDERIKPLSEKMAWQVAISAAVRAINASSFRNSYNDNTREGVVGRSLMALKRKGFGFEIDGLGARLTKPAYNKVCAKIEQKICRVGGFDAANALLNVMTKSSRIYDGSLLHARTPAQIYRTAEAGTPWHYIYTLALKHIEAKPTRTNAEKILQDMEELAGLMAASLNVEPQSSYENLSLSGPGLPGALYDTVIYDELFAFPQWQPLAAEFLGPVWLDQLESAGCNFPVARKDQWADFLAGLLRLARSDQLIQVRSLDFVSPGLTAEQAFQMLEALNVADGALNSGYMTPSDNKARNSTFYPVFRARGDVWVVQPKAVVSRALIERLFTLMRQQGDAELGNKYGVALERTTEAILRHFGMEPTFRNAGYAGSSRGQTFEVDLVYETPERIFLVECTKKPLTAPARGGHTMAIINDLEASFLKLVQQLAHHEARLRSDGRIDFDDGRSLLLGGRKIEKIGISLFDHGSLQDRNMTMSLINLLAGSQMTTDHPEFDAITERTNRRLEKLAGSIREIIGVDEKKAERAFFSFAMSTWWLSIDQLFYLCAKGGGLWQGLLKPRHLTNRSGDLIAEIRRFETLNPVAQALLDNAQKMDNRALL
ncbi:hypothetical protein B7H23_01360 [Notoacmeibacter marinus]|uniref:Uncharacterized protein n=1 Tax=Notoacmeibacter marinus TaxID=1876515 RepID=A0A231V0C7_9HYPH|nr:hypothetical protein [Notoacmeibacter marinus]OXT01648.1 hypothetical protein B7H23_01360 [Notoacmeibacter marinus]